MFQTKVILSILILFFISFSHADIVVYKYHVSNYAVVDEDLVVTIKIFNVGENTAFDVTVTDQYSEDDFTKSRGIYTASFEKISPGGNVSHSFVLKPKKSGYHESNPAKVEYRTSPRGPVEVTYSNDIGIFDVDATNELARRTNPHWKEWGIFAVLALVAVVPAYYQWSSITTEYENGIKRDKKNK